MKPIPYARQDLNERDIERVLEVLRGDWLTQGPMIPQFEQALAEYCSARGAVVVSNGTAALHLAARALELGPGDTLWTSPNTFVASANCALYCGASVDFVDIDPRTYNLSPTALESKLAAAKANGKLPAAVVPVHFAGQSCDMEAIGALAKEYGFRIIEDASHAIGGSYQGQKIGCCAHSDMAVFSFHPAKNLTTGEGGAVVANDPKLLEAVGLLRTHGITRDPARMRHESHGGWYYEQIDLGLNYRITDIQAALGLSQLERLDRFIELRHAAAARYDAALADLPVVRPWQDATCTSGLHLYVIRLKLDEITKSKREVFDTLRAAGILVNLHYIPVHLHPYYADLGFRPGDFPEAERYYKEAITLPMYATLSAADQEHVVDVLREAL